MTIVEGSQSILRAIDGIYNTTSSAVGVPLIQKANDLIMGVMPGDSLEFEPDLQEAFDEHDV